MNAAFNEARGALFDLYDEDRNGGISEREFWRFLIDVLRLVPREQIHHSQSASVEARALDTFASFLARHQRCGVLSVLTSRATRTELSREDFENALYLAPDWLRVPERHELESFKVEVGAAFDDAIWEVLNSFPVLWPFLRDKYAVLLGSNVPG